MYQLFHALNRFKAGIVKPHRRNADIIKLFPEYHLAASSWLVTAAAVPAYINMLPSDFFCALIGDIARETIAVTDPYKPTDRLGLSLAAIYQNKTDKFVVMLDHPVKFIRPIALPAFELQLALYQIFKKSAAFLRASPTRVLPM